MSWSEFFAMGNYGFYIWTSYALAAIVLIVNVVLPLWQRKALHKRLKEYYRVHQRHL